MDKKIAFVNIAKIINGSKIAQLEVERNQLVKDIYIQAERAAEKAYTTMSEEAKQQSRAIDAANINNAWLGEQQHTRLVSLQAIQREVESFRELKKFALILNSEIVVAADTACDVTEDIIDRMLKVEIDYGIIPSFTVKADSAPQKTK